MRNAENPPLLYRHARVGRELGSSLKPRLRSLALQETACGINRLRGVVGSSLGHTGLAQQPHRQCAQETKEAPAPAISRNKQRHCSGSYEFAIFDLLAWFVEQNHVTLTKQAPYY